MDEPVELVVGRLGRAHGIRGELTVEVLTDDPDERFAVGTALRTQPAERGPLVVTRARWHSGRLLLAFDGIEDRSAAEELRDTRLVVDAAELPPVDEPDSWRDHELVGLRAEDPAGRPLGRVVAVEHRAQDLLVLEGDVLVPFVAAIVPVVDVAGGRVVVDAPPGLLELGATVPPANG